jgi:DNA repair protein RecN (Recombination protein N)
MLFEALQLSLQRGMCLLAGETGAGKSILIEALDAALGGRVNLDVVRSGAARSIIEATFRCDESTGWPEDLRHILEREGLTEPPGEELILSREITPRGSRCRIDGHLIPQATLREVGHLFVTIVSQHEHQRLGESEFQRQLLDSLGRHEPLTTAVAQAYGRWTELRSLYEKLQADSRQRAREEDFWRFQLAEIEAARLDNPHEMDALKAERLRLLHAQSLRAACEKGYQGLYAGEAEPSVYDQTERIVHTLSELTDVDEELAKAADSLLGVQAIIKDIASDLRRHLEILEADPQRLEEVEARLDVLVGLLRKWGPDLPAVLTHAEDLRYKLQALAHVDQQLNTMERDIHAAEEALRSACAALTVARQDAAERLEREVAEHLRELELPQARLHVKLRPYCGNGPFRAGGAENVEFEVSLNAGEAPRSLAKTASGGEMARVLLALQSVLARVDGVNTLVFDEVDTGISGRAARAVADKLATLAQDRQVLCITHLPPVAAMADQHIHLEKIARNGRTWVEARNLDDGESLRELAAMAGGTAAPAALQHAAELKSHARRFKDQSATPTRKPLEKT